MVEATQAGDGFGREVAIKILHQRGPGPEIRRRFGVERQILGTLTHPKITRLYEVGMADDGRPYLVMELVAGKPLDRYCGEANLPLAERVAIFERICDAVGHAQQNLVIHRDLKLSNVLVNGDGCPKLLDFGIAKVLQSTLVSD